MAEINIRNAAGRDAVVNLENVHPQSMVRWLDLRGRQAGSIRVLKSTVDRDLPALQEKIGNDLEEVAQALLEGDPEVDMEHAGTLLGNTSRVYLDPDRKMVHKVQVWEIVRDPHGKEIDRRPRASLPPNVSGETPLNWSGKMIPKEEACRRFVFALKMQLYHINGLTYDFLFEMARTLEEKNSMLLLGGGPNGTQPLVLRRGGSPYRGFLEGRTDGERYCLILHLSNQELKPPAPDEDAEEEGDA